MPELYIALLHVDGEFVYAGTRAESVVAAVAGFASEHEMQAIEWLQTYDSLPERGQQSEPVQSVLALLESWIDGAVERFGEFELGDHALVAEVRLDDDVELGWAFHGSLRGAAGLFERAAHDARE